MEEGAGGFSTGFSSSPGDVAQSARAPALQAGGRGFESHRLHVVVSRDIPDGCRETSRTNLGSFTGLIVLRRVEGEVTEQLTVVLGDDPDVEVVDQ